MFVLDECLAHVRSTSTSGGKQSSVDPVLRDVAVLSTENNGGEAEVPIVDLCGEGDVLGGTGMGPLTGVRGNASISDEENGKKEVLAGKEARKGRSKVLARAGVRVASDVGTVDVATRLKKHKVSFGSAPEEVIVDRLKIACAKGYECRLREDPNAQDASVIGNCRQCKAPLHDMCSEVGEECGPKWCGRLGCIGN